jgi:hypothetical protein
MKHAHAWKPRVIAGGAPKGRGRKWEMVYQGLTETRNALRRGNPLEAHSHLQFTIQWADKHVGKKRGLVESFASVVAVELDAITRLIPRRGAPDDGAPVYVAITALRRFIEREAKMKAVHAAQALARENELSQAAMRRALVRAIEDAVERALGRR